MGMVVSGSSRPDDEWKVRHGLVDIKMEPKDYFLILNLLV